MENLFSYRAEGASLSKDIVKRTEKLEAGYKVAKYEIVHEKKQENGLENEKKVSDITIKRFVQFTCVNLVSFPLISAANLKRSVIGHRNFLPSFLFCCILVET